MSTTGILTRNKMLIGQQKSILRGNETSFCTNLLRLKRGFRKVASLGKKFRVLIQFFYIIYFCLHSLLFSHFLILGFAPTLQLFQMASSSALRMHLYF